MIFRLSFFCCMLAFTAMTGIAQADDTNELKAQLQALENQVVTLSRNTEQKKPASSAGPIIIERGQGSMAEWKTESKRDGEIPPDTGYTITTNPASNNGFPKTEVTISGAVSGTMIVDGK
jgi:hypothetical protein